MKKNVFKGIVVFFAMIFVSCNSQNNSIQKEADCITFIAPNKDGKALSFNKKYDNFSGVTIVNLEKVTNRNPVVVDLTKYADKGILFEFSCDMKIVDTKNPDSVIEINWMINEVNENLPSLVQQKVQSGKWTSLKGNKFVNVGKNRQFYLSGAGFNKENHTIYLKNFKLKLSGEGIGNDDGNSQEISWLEAPSLKEAYKDIFDYFGLAVTYNQELALEEVQNGLAHQTSSFTMGNEFKPDFIFNWQPPKQLIDFTAENGKTYKIPQFPPAFVTVDKILEIAKSKNLKMRGHVLVWHNQTPGWFFTTNYGIGGEVTFVTPEEMNARLEWYIKTVLTHIKEWEEQNNNDQRIITIWDVVNEAISDNATESRYLRDEKSSKWFQIYQSDEFIVNAFRYANKYAPKEVKLVYNDYNLHQPNKVNGALKIVDAIQAVPDARIDAIGMQTHIKIDYPQVTGYGSFEEAVQKYIEKGLNVQITEMDIANGKSGYNPVLLKSKYNEYFKMFIKNRKTETSKGIEGVTLWGLNDETTWLNALQEYKGLTQYPLLFRTNDYLCKPAFYGVLEAAEN